MAQLPTFRILSLDIPEDGHNLATLFFMATQVMAELESIREFVQDEGAAARVYVDGDDNLVFEMLARSSAPDPGLN